MFKRINLKIIIFLSLLAVGAAAIHRMGGAGSIGQQALWGSLAPPPAEAAGTIYVDADASGADTGATWTDAYLKLQDPLAAAVSGDQIWVAAGVYYPDEGAGQINDDRTSTFMLINGVELYGGFAGTETTLGGRNWETNVTVLSGDIDQNDTTDPNGVVIDVANIVGNNAYHVVTGGGTVSSAMLDGFTVTAGQANVFAPGSAAGAGMSNVSSSPTLTNVTFSGNLAYSGGGMYNDASSPVLTNVIFSGNEAFNFGSGGGMYNYNSSNPTITDVIFSGNQAGSDGGGMYNFSSHPMLMSVSFVGNQASSRGGGMANYSASNPSLNDVSFTGNQAQDGGGMRNSTSSPTLTDVTFTGNVADSGGGMSNATSNPTLTDVDFSGNQAQNGAGGGMNNNASSSPNLMNVTFTGNQSSIAGGGMINANSSPTLMNITFAGNQAVYKGGGMSNDSSSPALTNVTFTGNQTVWYGGGLYNENGSNPLLINAVLWNNFAGISGHQIYNSSSTPVISNSDIQGSGGSSSWDTVLGTDGGGNIDANPLFIMSVDPATAPTTVGDLHLQSSSPAVDGGTNSGCPGTDLDGNLRPIDGDLDGTAVCDMGAYEKLIDLFLPQINR